MNYPAYDPNRIGFEQETAYYAERGNYDLAVDFLSLKQKINAGIGSTRDKVVLEIIRLEMEQRGER